MGCHGSARCPRCGGKASMSSPDYGRGAEYSCSNCSVYGARFVLADPASRAERASAVARNAELCAENLAKTPLEK